MRSIPIALFSTFHIYIYIYIFIYLFILYLFIDIYADVCEWVRGCEWVGGREECVCSVSSNENLHDVIIEFLLQFFLYCFGF